jgi:hypothetical protein
LTDAIGPPWWRVLFTKILWVSDQREPSGRLSATPARYPVVDPERWIMTATVTKLDNRRHATGKAGGPTIRAAIDAFLDSPKIKGNRNTLRAYTGVLDRTAEEIGADRALASVEDSEIGGALTEL